MPAAITNYTNVGTTPVPIVAQTTGATVNVYQAALATTSTLIWYAAVPPATSGAAVPSANSRLYAAGAVIVPSKGLTYPEPYAVGEVIGFIAATTGTITVQCHEFGS